MAPPTPGQPADSAEPTGPALPVDPELPPPEQRGRLTLAAAVVRGIVEAAAGEVDGVTAERSGLTRSARVARANVQLDGTVAAVRVRLALRYPVSIPQTLEQVRTHIAERVGTLAGVTVRSCDLEVTGLLAEAHDRRIR